MRKIPTLFIRNPDDRAHVIVGEVTPGCEWVLAGEGVATRKYDGTCTYLNPEGSWWARREVKKGKQPPAGFKPQEYDEVTGKTVGWEPMAQSPFAKFHAEALTEQTSLPPGTYELLGPKVNGNPEGLDRHMLQSHASAGTFEQPSADPLALIEVCRHWGYEGIVWHNPDGRMAKLKVRDLA